VTEPRRRLRERLGDELAATGAKIERLRNLSMAVAASAVLVVVAVLWGGRAFTLDPTRRAADELEVPHWAATTVGDETYGSRWCIGECRVRVRTWASEGTADDTADEYWRALLDAGWRPAEPDECLGGDGSEGCYLRDELFLELWVAPRQCADRYELCVGSEVRAVIAAQAALPRLARDQSR
jgi:hypothetical protein